MVPCSWDMQVIKWPKSELFLALSKKPTAGHAVAPEEVWLSKGCQGALRWLGEGEDPPEL